MAGSLEGVLARIPGLGGYLGGQEQDRVAQAAAQNQQMGQLQQMGALQGILAKVQAAKQEQEFRGALSQLGPNPSQESLAALAARFSPPKDILTSQTASADRRAAMQAASVNQQAGREERASLQTERLEAHRENLRQRAEDQRLSLAERNQARLQLAQFMVANRPPRAEPAPQPPVAVKKIDGTGNEFVDRKDSLGREPAVKETADRVIPANIAKAYSENSTALRKIDSALAEVGKYPQGFGLQNIGGDAVNQRIDPKGVTARAIVADIGSLKIHDRSGAAVTAAETPRLLPFIPGVNDKAETVKKKLALFRKEYQDIQNDIGSMYSSEQGYRVLPSAQTRSSDKNRIRFDAKGNIVSGD